HPVFDCGTGEVLRTAGGDLDDAVALGVGEAAQCRVEGLRRRDVDGGIRERACLGPGDHLGVNLGIGDGHESSVSFYGSRPTVLDRVPRRRGTVVSLTSITATARACE